MQRRFRRVSQSPIAPREQSRVRKSKIGSSVLARRSLLLFFPLILIVGIWINWNLSVVRPETSYSSTDMNHIPAQCLEMHQRFHRCQYSSSAPVVLACHRKWCQSYGHCEPCAGIGDRSIHMIELALHALDRCIPLKLDYPMLAVDIVDNAIYRDPLWFWESLLHLRSYDVSSRKLDLEQWGKQMAFVHFIPDDPIPPRESSPEDVCMFHILFQPSQALKQELNRHLNNMGPANIGMHLRTGDATSFGIGNKDDRIQSNELRGALEKMIDCAQKFGEQVFPNRKEKYTIFLATDSAQVKLWSQEIDTTKERFSIYSTHFQPASYLRSSNEFDAWVELFLLSRMNALVVNNNRKGYQGEARPTSCFSDLARRIGFLDQVKECSLD